MRVATSSRTEYPAVGGASMMTRYVVPGGESLFGYPPDDQRDRSVHSPSLFPSQCVSTCWARARSADNDIPVPATSRSRARRGAGRRRRRSDRVLLIFIGI